MNAVPETKLGTTIVNHVLGDRGSRHLPSYLQPSTGRNIIKPEMAQTNNATKQQGNNPQLDIL